MWGRYEWLAEIEAFLVVRHTRDAGDGKFMDANIGGLLRRGIVIQVGCSVFGHDGQVCGIMVEKVWELNTYVPLSESKDELSTFHIPFL